MLVELVLAGEHAVVHGPIHVGKSALLREVERVVRRRSARVGLATTVRALGDVTAALARAHPDVRVTSVPARTARSRLRNAADAVPSVLLLDDVRGAGTMLKGFLRSLRGTPLGVLLAVDVNGPRDHARMRTLRLARREVDIPRLHASSLRSIVKTALASSPLDHALNEEDLRALVHASDGLPGRALSFVARLADASVWRDGRVRVGALRAQAIIDELERYRVGLEWGGAA